jgi:hypothetical protein
MHSKRHPQRIAVIVKEIAREVNFEVRVTPYEAFAVHMGPPTVPKGSSTETSPLVIVERPAVQLDDDSLIAVFPGGYKAFRLAPDGRWTRQPGGWARSTETSLVKITVNVFHAMMWRRLKHVRADLGALDEIPWEENSTTVCSKDISKPQPVLPPKVAIISDNVGKTHLLQQNKDRPKATKVFELKVDMVGEILPETAKVFELKVDMVGEIPLLQQNEDRSGAANPGTAAAQEVREESSGHTPPETVTRVSGKDDLPPSPAAKPLGQRLSRIKKSSGSRRVVPPLSGSGGGGTGSLGPIQDS